MTNPTPTIIMDKKIIDQMIEEYFKCKPQTLLWNEARHFAQELRRKTELKAGITEMKPMKEDELVKFKIKMSTEIYMRRAIAKLWDDMGVKKYE